MAVETIMKVLSPTNATYVNNVSAERRFSPAILENFYQGAIEKDGRGVNDKFVTSGDAQEAAQVFVNRVLPVKMKPREQGASKNGASFSANQHYVQTETVGIEILMTLDDPIIIARARQDMIRVDLLAQETEIFSKRFNTIMNGATAASKLLSSFLATERNAVVISSSDETGKLVAQRFVEANSLLDEGDSAHGIDMFPDDTKIAVVKVSYRPILKAQGILLIGGANYAYDILRGNAISEGATARKAEDGYIGDIDGVPCHVISNESLGHASEFLGFPYDELKLSSFIGYLASSYANARGASVAERTKIVDAQAGQGIILQPYIKFGVASWYPLGNVILSKEEYNPFALLKKHFSGSLSSIVFKLKPSGSRLYPALSAASWETKPTATSDNFKIGSSGALALDDNNTDHFVAALWVQADTPLRTVDGFLKEYDKNTVTEKGSVTPGTTTSAVSALTADKYITVLAISSDGSCSLSSEKVGA